MKHGFLLIFALIIFLPEIVSAQTSYYITSKDGAKIFVQEFGKGAPVVLLAGGPGLNPDYLQPLWNTFSKNYRCIVLNERGTGKSILPVVDSVSMSMDNYVNDIEALREHLKLEKLTLLGHSWGGMLCMVYLAKEPQHVKKIILLDSGGPSEEFAKRFDDNLNKRLTPEDQAEAKRLDSLGLDDSKAKLPGYFYDRNRALAAAKAMPENMHGQPGVFQYTAANYFAGSHEMMKNLRKTTAPVSLIQGMADPMGEATAMDIKEVLPQAKIHFIEHAGHFPWMENPPQVKEFFEQMGKDLR
jgi:proline iminopeptidase